MGKGYWKLNNSILKQDFQEMFCKFWKDLQNQKPKYNFINQWWESGKIYFKMFTIKFSTIKNQNINNKHQNLTKSILQEKNEKEPL